MVVWWFFIPIRYSFTLEHPLSLISIGVFAVMGLLFSLTHARLRKANQQKAAALAAVKAAKDNLEERISERTADLVRISDSLRESEEKYRTLVENIPQKVFTKDRDSVYVSCNKNFARELGITPEEFAGKTDYDFFPKELADKYRSDDRRIMESGETEDLEEQYLQGGQNLWVQTIKTPIRNKKGDTVGLLGIFSDITKRKQAEDSLREREERYRCLVEAIGQSNIGIFLVDPDYRVRFMNQPLVAAFGDQTGRICYEGVGRDNVPCSYCKIDEVIRDKKIVDYHPTTAIGKIYDIVAIPFKDNDGVTCKLEVIQDITERSRVDAALLESEHRLRRFYESGMLGVIYWNMNGQILEANDKFLEMVGYTREELNSGQIDWINMTPPEFRDLDDKSVKELKATGVNRTPFEKEYLRKDGSRMPIILAGAMLDEERFNGVAFVLDITERNRAEEALLLSEEKLTKAFRASPDWMTISTLEEGRYIDVNDAFVQITGYGRDEVIGKTSAELGLWSHPEERTQAKELIKKEGRLRDFESLFRMRSGEIRVMRRSAEVIELLGEQCLVAVNRDITERRQAQEKVQETLKNLRKAMGGIIQVISATVEARDPYTAGHQKRVADLARAIAGEMGLAADQREGLRMAGTIHDLGKVSIPAEILSKPTKLSEIEYQLIQVHPQIGYDILKEIEFPWPIAEMVLQHHERMNGSGYPRGLQGEAISIEARILMVADVVEAMASYRPYRPARGIEAALEEIEKNGGTIYDQIVVDACLRLFREKGFQLEVM